MNTRLRERASLIALGGGISTQSRGCTDRRAISPVVGTALLIVVTVLLVSVINGMVFGVDGTDAPQAQLQAEFHLSANATIPAHANASMPAHANATVPAVTISHRGGDPLLAAEIIFILNDGTELQMENYYTGGAFTAGESFTLDLPHQSTTLTVVWHPPNSDSETILAKFEV